MQSATVNPFLAAILALILSDVLLKAKLITLPTRSLIQTVTLIYLGVNVTSDVLGLISQFVQDLDPTDFLKGLTGSPNTQALGPNVQTVVFSGDLQDLLAKIGALK